MGMAAGTAAADGTIATVSGFGFYPAPVYIGGFASGGDCYYVARRRFVPGVGYARRGTASATAIPPIETGPRRPAGKLPRTLRPLSP